MALDDNRLVKGSTFQYWKREVNRHTVQLSGMETEEFADWDYRTAWESGMTPRAAAQKAIRAAKNS